MNHTHHIHAHARQCPHARHVNGEHVVVPPQRVSCTVRWLFRSAPWRLTTQNRDLPTRCGIPTFDFPTRIYLFFRAKHESLTSLKKSPIRVGISHQAGDCKRRVGYPHRVKPLVVEIRKLTHVDKRTPCWEMARWWVSSTRPSNHGILSAPG